MATSIKGPDDKEQPYLAKGGSIPEATLKIPMPTEAKSPPPAPSTKPGDAYKNA